MKPQALALTLDFGTQSVRALIINKQGDVLAMTRSVYHPTYLSTKPGEAEQTAEFYWNELCKITQALKTNHGDLLAQVVTSSVTMFRDTAICLDDQLKPVRNIILWLDQRMATFEPFPFWIKMAYHLTGLYEMAHLNSRRTMARWIRQNEPHHWKKTKYYVALSTYFNYLLTGHLIDSAANQIGRYPIDFQKATWYKPTHLKAAIFNIPVEKLAPLVKPGEVIGHITKQAAQATGLPEGLVVYATGPDKGAETIGTGSLTPDVANISYGTSCTITVSNPRYVEPEHLMPAYPAIIPNLYNSEIHVNRGYWMISWFIKEFAHQETTEALISKLAIEEVLNQELLNIPPGSEGLVLSPYWGPGLRRPEAKGAIIGWSDVHTKVHMYRAIIEGIAFALKEGFLSIQQRQKKKITSLHVSGGGSKSSAICQITADIFGLPVTRIQTPEASSLGVAIASFLAAKEFKSPEEAVQSMVHTKDTFYPDPINQARYDYLFHKVYKKIYPRLHSVYKDIIRFNQ